MCSCTVDTSMGRRNFKSLLGHYLGLSLSIKADFGPKRMLLSKDTSVSHRHNSQCSGLMLDGKKVEFSIY